MNWKATLYRRPERSELEQLAADVRYQERALAEAIAHRNACIVAYHRRGARYAAIARSTRITPARVQQICEREIS